jgi:hypothetical protein
VPRLMAILLYGAGLRLLECCRLRVTRHPHSPGTLRPPRCQHHDDLHACSQPGTGRSPEPRRPDVPVMTSQAGNIGLAADAQVIRCSASRCITASEPGRVLQRCRNAGTFGSRAGSFVMLYRTTQLDNVVQERSS